MGFLKRLFGREQESTAGRKGLPKADSLAVDEEEQSRVRGRMEAEMEEARRQREGDQEAAT